MQPTTIRFNEKERENLEKLKVLVNTKGEFGEDSKTIKIAIDLALNVIPNIFGDEWKVTLQRKKVFEKE